MILLSNHRNIFAKHLVAGVLVSLISTLQCGEVLGQSAPLHDRQASLQPLQVTPADQQESGQTLQAALVDQQESLQPRQVTPADRQASRQRHQETSDRPAISSLSSPCNNYISISGETNINMFSLDQYVPEDLVCGAGDSRWIKLPDEEVYLIRIPVRNFEASNRIVYKDFLEMIDVKKHPYINIFMDESEFRMLFQDRSFFLPRIGISVAGTTRYYQVPCRVTDCVDGKISVSGRKTLKLTDFKLAPPEKTMGLIKVQNELIINFEFSLPSESGIKLSKI